MNCSVEQLLPPSPGWHKAVLFACATHSGLWGAFIMSSPAMSATVYGFEKIPRELHLWQGAGLFIFLLAIGYGIAATDPRHHWSVVLVGLLAKVLGAAGMCFAVYRQQVSPNVLWLIPVNDVIWWWPLWQVVKNRSIR